MTLTHRRAANARIADLPLSERRQIDVEKALALQEGLTRNHLAVARERHLLDLVYFDRALRAGPALAEELSRITERRD